MPDIVSVVFGQGGKKYHFDPGSLELAVGDQVVVETARGTDCGRVVEAAHEQPEGGGRPALRRVLRVGDEGRHRAGGRQPRARVRGAAAGPRARRQGRRPRHQGGVGRKHLRRQPPDAVVLRPPTGPTCARSPRSSRDRLKAGSSSTRCRRATRRVSSAATAPAAATSAAPASAATRSRSRSAWPKTRTCPSTPRRSRAAAAASCAASSTSTASICRSRSAPRGAAPSLRRRRAGERSLSFWRPPTASRSTWARGG